MESTVKSPPNHYEALGLTPAASEEDIARAFARELSPLRPHGIGGLARVSLAYETLRDPAKRRAYDESIGIMPEPAPGLWPAAGPDGWRVAAYARFGPPGGAVGDILPEPAPSLARPADPEPRPEVPTEPQAAPFIAASPPDPVAADARDDRAATLRPQPAHPRPRPAPQAAGDRALRTAMEERVFHLEDSAIEWKRPALIGGALFVSVALLGGWLGWESSNDVEAQPPQQALALAVPKAPSPDAASPPAAAAPSAAEARPERRAPAAAAKPRVAPTAPQPRPPEEQATQVAGGEQDRLEEIAAELAAADSAPVAATPAKLPLSNATVARTIGRIGYACGQVASTTAVEGGAPGVFKVTCTSGDSYRAAPAGGRYRFRRWGGN